MAKILIMAEGKCEKAFLTLLIERELLIFRPEDLLYEDVFQIRQIKPDTEAMINSLPSKEKIHIYRVGDKLSDELSISNRIDKSRIEKQIKVVRYFL